MLFPRGTSPTSTTSRGTWQLVVLFGYSSVEGSSPSIICVTIGLFGTKNALGLEVLLEFRGLNLYFFLVPLDWKFMASARHTSIQVAH
jgi:hypothetical protein